MESENDSEFLLRYNIIKYLDQYGIMNDLEKKSYEFSLELCNPNKIYPIFYYSITINPTKLGSISGNTFKLLLNEPIYFENVIRSIILSSIQTFTMNATIQYDQVQLQMYIDPLLVPIPMTMMSFRRQQQIVGLCTLKVILIGHSDIQKFMRMSIWNCSQYCVNDITTMYTLPSTTTKCCRCGCCLKEHKNARIISERINAQMIIRNESQNHKSSVNETIMVELLDNLCKDLELGVAYKLTGYMNTNGTFKALGLVQDLEKLPFYNISNILFPKILKIKDSKSPYQFVYKLASQLGVEQKLAPQELFINLKMGLLLSLASFNNNCDTIPLPILAVGFDSYLPNQLMCLTSKYATRCVNPSPNDNMIGIKTKDGWYEIGSLSLANSGICYLGDWSKYTNNKNGFVVKSALDSGQMQLDGSYKLPLKSSIWTYFTFQAKAKEQLQLQTLINIFGMPFLSDPHDEDLYVQHIVQQGVGTNIDLDNCQIIPEKELILYLRTVNSSTVVLTPSSEALMKDYFVTCRRCRQGSFPVRVFNSLLLFAESHAKICLKSETTKHDAIVAIWLLEESIQAVYGVNIDNPPPRCTYEIQKIDEYFSLFESWLHKFISSNLHNKVNNAYFTQP